MIDNTDLLPEEEPRLAPPSSDAFSWRRVITQLRHASVRDLAFLLLSPPLLHPGHPRWKGAVQEFSEEELRVWRRWLLVQDMAPEALERFLTHEAASNESSPTRLRLGHYAEQLLAFALSNAPPDLGLTLIARNVTLVAAGSRTTSGELDFVVERHGVVEHWEMAVKFYLCIGNQSLEDFVAPAALAANIAGNAGSALQHSAIDSLGSKLAHMFDKQLALDALLKHSETPEFDIPGSITVSRAYLRGWLFYPAYARGYAASSVPTDWGLHPQHAHGIWLKEEDAATLKPGSWMELPRLGWLSPARIARNKNREYPAVTLSSAEETASHGPSLWTQMKKDDKGARQELQRVFVIPSMKGAGA